MVYRVTDKKEKSLPELKIKILSNISKIRQLIKFPNSGINVKLSELTYLRNNIHKINNPIEARGILDNLKKIADGSPIGLKLNKISNVPIEQKFSHFSKNSSGQDTQYK